MMTIEGKHMICNECETVSHCLKNGRVPKQPSKDEALKLALEALENLLEQYYCNSVAGTDCDQAHDAITAIKQALNDATHLAAPAPEERKRPWVRLTQEEIDIAFDDTQEGGGFDDFAYAIEAKLKAKNSP
jgi:hypothetical protein